MASTNWATEQAKRAGNEIRRLRAGRSAQWLSDQTATLGHRVGRATISELETGRRPHVTTAELIVLARALDTAPVALMYPAPYSAEVELLPGQSVKRWSAVQWFSGRWPDATAWLMSNDGDAYMANTRALRAAGRLTELEQRRQRIMAAIAAADDKGARIGLVDDLTEVQNEMHRLSVEVLSDGG